MHHCFRILDRSLRLHLVHQTSCANKSIARVTFRTYVDRVTKVITLGRAQIQLTKLLLSKILIVDIIHHADNFHIPWHAAIESSTDALSNRRSLAEIVSGEALADHYHLG